MKKLAYICAILIIFISSILTPAKVTAYSVDNTLYDSLTYKFLYEFVNTTPIRDACSKGEANAIAYLERKFHELGYVVDVSPFDFSYQDKTYTSKNIIIKSGVNVSNKPLLFIGAHYDCVENSGQGAFDNAAGVATVYAIASDWINNPNRNSMPYEVVFVLFGVEELGLYGSSAFVNALTQGQVDRTIAMINIDTIAAGDSLYIYTEDKPTSYQDLFMSISKDIGTVKLNAMPVAKSITTTYWGYPNIVPYMHTGQLSDHSSFRARGIPTVMFFSGNLSKSYGYIESATNENIMHTTSDTIATLEQMYGTEYIANMEFVRKLILTTITDGKFSEVMANARQELVNYSLWFNSWYPAIISAGIVIIFCFIGYLKLQSLRKKAITDTTVIKPTTAFTKPDEQDIFSFRK